MDQTTLAALTEFPRDLERFYCAIPPQFKDWAPPSWEGIPSERFTAIEQICHVRDIEIDGYYIRFQRTLLEVSPKLGSIDGYSMAKERGYSASNAPDVFAAFGNARAATVRLLTALSREQLKRTAVLEGYGGLTLQGLAHYLCSHDQQHLAGLQWLLGKIDATVAGQDSDGN